MDVFCLSYRKKSDDYMATDSKISRIFSKFVRKSQVAFKGVLCHGKSQGTFMDIFGWSEGLLSLSIGRNPMIPWLVIKKLKKNSMIFLKFVRKSQRAFKGISGCF